MANGTVKWFNAQKGFGFIQPDNGGKDVFVHISAVEAAGLSGLNEGQKVSFEIANQRGRDAAANLQALQVLEPRLRSRGSLIFVSKTGPLAGRRKTRERPVSPRKPAVFVYDLPPGLHRKRRPRESIFITTAFTKFPILLSVFFCIVLNF